MKGVRVSILAAAVVLLAAGAAAAQQAGGVVVGTAPGVVRPGLPPRDPNEKVPTGAAVISGRVTVASAGTPLRHAQVMLNASEQSVWRSTTTDAEGRYRFADLPAGRYVLTVNKAGYVSAQYGQRRSSEPGTALLLADGQSVSGVNVALPRGSVIAGRVTDEFGEPIARASVQALRYLYGPDGQRRPQPNQTATTDDLGQFRLFGLTPGEYIVSASGQPGFVAVAGPSVVDTSATYLTSYFPGTPNINDAQTIPVAAGQEANVQFALNVGRLSRVAGTVVDSTGKPLANAMTTLQSPTGGFLGGAGGGMTGPDGAFALANVAPGDYVLNVQPINRFGGDAPIAESGSVPLTVGDADILNLRVTTSAGATVTGRVVFEGTAPRDNSPGGKTRVFPQFSTFGVQPGVPVGSESGVVGDDGSFELKGVRGQLMFRVAAGPAWTLKSVSLEGTDITDVPTDLRGPEGLSGVTIVLTDKLTDVSGQVTDGRGQPVKDFLVVVQPGEPKSGTALTRYLRTVRPEPDGRFRVRGLPPGDYFATAVESLEQGQQFVPDVQARLRDSARRFTVREGETVVFDLRLTPGFE
jgi:protocatechuate 3,4-dioxygenase beta subunit